MAGCCDGIALDAVVLAAFAAMKWKSDPLIVVIDIVGMAPVFLFVWVLLARNPSGKALTSTIKKSLSFQSLEAAG